MATENGESISNFFAQLDIADEPSSSTNATIDDERSFSSFNDAKSGQLYLLGKWYLDPEPEIKSIMSELEILHKQAAYYVWKCNYRHAFEIYQNILDAYVHKEGHRRELLDAMVHCALRGNLEESLETSYLALKRDVGTFGDQLNLWSTTVTVIECGLVSSLEHMSAVIYLCTLAECGRHWAMFDKIDTSFLPEKCQFRFGAKVRAFFMLKQEHSNFERSANSIERITENLMNELRTELLAEYTEEQIVHVRDRMCFDIIKTYKPSDEPQEPPPHACKLDSVVKTSEELDIIRTHFVSKFEFLFEDNPELAEKLSCPQNHEAGLK